jgi:hypothetical protein
MDNILGEKETHPSFGMLQFNRTNSSPPEKFFGSELAHGEYITMELFDGEVRRNLNRDWHFAGRTLCKVRLTNLAFAELITGMNVGSGVPVTIEYTESGKRPPLPESASLKDLSQKEMKDKLFKMSDEAKEHRKVAEGLIAKKSLTNEDRKTLLSIFHNLFQEIDSNIPFALESFHEATDRVVTEAKMEVEGAIQHKLASLGLDSLKLLMNADAKKEID